MPEFIRWLILIPVLVFACRFWFGVGKWAIRERNTMSDRIKAAQVAASEFKKGLSGIED